MKLFFVLLSLFFVQINSFSIPSTDSSFQLIDASVATSNKLHLNSIENSPVSTNGVSKSTKNALISTKYQSKENEDLGKTIVSLVIDIGNLKKGIQVPSVQEPGFLIIHMDKLIYFPEETALIRIISLRENGLSSEEPYILQIKNPQELIVEERTIHPVQRAFVNHTYKFPKHSPLGKWSVQAWYKEQFQRNASAHLDLLAHDLPTFNLWLSTPSAIFPGVNVTRITVNAKYANGQKVTGFALFRVGVQSMEKIRFIKRSDSKELINGSYTLELKTKDILEHAASGNFEDVHHLSLFVEAVVDDTVKGMKKVVVDNKCQFFNDSIQASFAENVPSTKALITHEDELPTSKPAANSDSHTDNENKPKSYSSKGRSRNIYLELRTNSIHDEISIKIDDTFTDSFHRDSRDIQKTYYPVDELGDEYYPGEDGTRHYEKDEDNNEVYAKKKNGDQFYLTNNGTQSYATNKDKIPYYAKLSNGKEIYAERNNTQFYIKISDREEYAKDESGNFYYAFDVYNSMVYASDKKGEYYINNGNGGVYALNKDNEQKYAKLANLDEYFATNENGSYYVKHGEKEIYPKTATKNEFYLKRECEEIYALEKAGRQYYAQMENGFQVPAKRYGVPYYAQIENSAEIYPYDDSQNQYYIRVGDRGVYARNEEGGQYYAKRNSGDEFYARRYDD